MLLLALSISEVKSIMLCLKKYWYLSVSIRHIRSWFIMSWTLFICHEKFTVGNLSSTYSIVIFVLNYTLHFYKSQAIYIHIQQFCYSDFIKIIIFKSTQRNFLNHIKIMLYNFIGVNPFTYIQYNFAILIMIIQRSIKRNFLIINLYKNHIIFQILWQVWTTLIWMMGIWFEKIVEENEEQLSIRSGQQTAMELLPYHTSSQLLNQVVRIHYTKGGTSV